ncbi:MAG: IspD/TarI family cytidylyltransferase, partial [Acidimicrobiia bacterium]
VVVAAGSSVRFGGDKLLEEVAGLPVVAHAVAAVRAKVDVCILVGRAEHLDELLQLDLDVEVVPGGATRTLSEMAGLAALGAPPDLIGIHDGARPLVTPSLVENLFGTAAEVGGAVPVIPANTLLVERATLRRAAGLVTAQTPQVFRGPELMAAYVRAAKAGFEGNDTAEVVERFSELEVAAVPGEPDNLKVTYRGDLEEVRRTITASSRNEPL